ncbi:MAG: hypothetical protein ACJ8LI_01315 [Chthoniobacterales bacterium]
MKELRDFTTEVSVVVSSCDAFFDAWRPFAFFFRKFWPACPFPVYLITNELDVHSSKIRAIRVGKDHGWASNMQVAMQQIATPYIFYYQEDYLLTTAVDPDQLARDFEYAIAQHAASLCFRDLSGLETQSSAPNERYIVVPAESKGRTRLQMTLWKRDALTSILQPGEDAWEMEAQGSPRTRELHMLAYARNADSPVQYLTSAIVRGLWTPEALALCRAHGVKIDPHFRRKLVDGKMARRWNRARTRAAYLLARRRQGAEPVQLD